MMRPGDILNLKNFEHIASDGNMRVKIGMRRRKEHLCVMVLGYEQDGADNLRPNEIMKAMGWSAAKQNV